MIYHYSLSKETGSSIKDPSRLGAARAGMVAFMLQRVRGTGPKRQAEISRDVSAMRAIQAQYDFRELLYFYRTQILGLVSEVQGITMTDIDDSRNRIIIGVENALLIGLVRERLKSLSVPDDAVAVIQFQPPVLETRPLAGATSRSSSFLLSQSLQTNLRPAIPGGAQIGGSYQNNNYVGTLSFNLVPSTGSDRFFLTCSHCAKPIFQFGGIGLGQPTWSGQLATEVVDPPLFVGTGPPGWCPNQKLCRWSEAALIRYDPGQEAYADQGRIAYPSVGSILFTSRVTVTAVEPPYVGQPVHKIGSQTGRTWGYVDQTCSNVAYPGSGNLWWLLCQGRASYSSGDGDSGSPIIAVTGDGTARGVGIHWAAPGWFSLLYQALDELYAANPSYGTMDPTGTPPPPPPPLTITITGPSSVRPAWTCLWTATSSNGVAPFSYYWYVNGSGVNNGSSDPAELIYQNSGSSFTVRVDVYDAAGSTGSQSKSVTVSSSAPGCGY
jgi:hypothetical protein